MIPLSGKFSLNFDLWLRRLVAIDSGQIKKSLLENNERYSYGKSPEYSKYSIPEIKIISAILAT